MGVLLSVIVPLYAPIVVALCRPVLPLILPLHQRLIASPQITKAFVDDHISHDGSTPFFTRRQEPLLKTIYRWIFNVLYNIVTFYLTSKSLRTAHAEAVRFVIDQSQSNDFEGLRKAARAAKSVFSARDIIVASPLMRELLQNSDAAFAALPGRYGASNAQLSVARFVVGQGLALNVKLSHAHLVDTLTEKEQDIRSDLRQTVANLTPLSKAVTLFHGFEPHVEYRFVYERTHMVNGVEEGAGARFLQLSGFVVKTPCVSLALQNAKRRSSLQPQVLIVRYPAGSKQLHFNVRFKDSEFEHFTTDHERLRVLSEHSVWQGCMCVTYYICEPVM